MPGIGHDEDGPVTSGCCYHGKPHSCIARRRPDYCASRHQAPARSAAFIM